MANIMYYFETVLLPVRLPYYATILNATQVLV